MRKGSKRKGTMATEEVRFKNRMKELLEQSRYTNSYIFSDFLSPLEQSYVREVGDVKTIQFWGGFDDAERVMARFGNSEDFGYEIDYPIQILRIASSADKFAERLGHRDFLGALVHLGLDRSVLGDILIAESGEAYVFVAERMTEFIKESLIRVRHTSVLCEEAKTLPKEAAPKRELRSLVVASERIDGIVSKLFGMSRTEAKSAFLRQEVFRNGRLCTNTSVFLDQNDVVTVRHKGKFVYLGANRKTKKGNERVDVELYVS